MDMVEFKFKHSSCVAVGTFNIYIVQPKLLAEMGVFEAEQPMLVSGDLTQPGIRFEIANSKWVVRPDRLSVESSAPNVNCGEFVERTLAALCWTPVMGVGINAVFTAPESAEQELPTCMQLPQHSDATQRSTHLSIPHDESVLNIQLSRTEKQVELSINVHSDFSQKKDTPKQLNESVRAICGSFLELRRSVIDVAGELLKAEFIYDQ